MRRAIVRSAAAMALLVSPLPLQASNSEAPSSATAQYVETAVVERTRLKANPGEREALSKFIIANWFAMDEIAVSQGLFTSYRLLENPDTDGEWDWIVEVGYPNPDGYSDPEVQAQFQAIREGHQTILIDGKSLRELGRVLRTERLKVKAGSY